MLSEEQIKVVPGHVATFNMSSRQQCKSEIPMVTYHMNRFAIWMITFNSVSAFMPVNLLKQDKQREETEREEGEALSLTCTLTAL